MVEPDEKLEKALRERRAQDRDQRQRRMWVGAAAASYAVDTLFLALFAAAGTIAGSVPLAYGAAAAAACGVTYAATASRLNLRARDPSLTEPLIIIGVALQLAVVAAAPQIAFPYLGNLFTVFTFGMIWLTVRESVAVWSLWVAASGILIYTHGERFAIPQATRFEAVLVWLYFSIILGRCLLLSVYANDLRSRLNDSRRKLADSLEHARQLASHDELTGALNRRALIARLEAERGRAERSRAPYAIALMDLDHFKAVNDSHGHAAGDSVLRGFAATVRDTMRATDAFGRYGGEEFLVILVATDHPAAIAATERVRAAVAGHDWPSIVPGLAVTTSAGVASYQAGESIEQLLRRADASLYEAKHAGRNRVVALSA